MLTICIPTYNRPDKVRQRVIELLPQLNDYVKILIIDNASVNPVSNVIEDLISGINSLKIIRNKYNIGMSANLARCIEYVDTEWLWILGDDDLVKCSAIDQIKYDIVSAADDVCCLKYSSYCNNNLKDEVLNLQEFLSHKEMGFDYVSNFFLISSSIIRVKNIYSFDKVMDTINSMVPHVVLIFQLLINGGKISFSKKEIIEKIDSSEISWSIMQLEFNLKLASQFPAGVDGSTFRLIKNFFCNHITFSPVRIFFLAHKMSKNRSREYVYYLYFGIILQSFFSKYGVFKFIPHVFLYLMFRLNVDELLPICFRIAGKNFNSKYKKFMN